MNRIMISDKAQQIMAGEPVIIDVGGRFYRPVIEAGVLELKPTKQLKHKNISDRAKYAVLDYLRAHQHEPLTIRDIAQAVFYSWRHTWTVLAVLLTENQISRTHQSGDAGHVYTVRDPHDSTI